MVDAVGTLSVRGWATTVKDKITEIMNHYTEAGRSQSVIYRGNIKSYSYACALYAQNPDLLTRQVERDLTTLYGNLFPAGVEVDCTYSYLTDSTVRYRIIISFRVLPTADGTWVDGVRYIEVDKGAYSE